MNSIELLLMFMIGDARINDAPRWSISLRIKIFALDLLKKRFLEQIPKASQELEEKRRSRQIRPANEYAELIVLYEAFLNSVYSLFENISQFVRILYRTKNLDWNFSDQKKKFLKNPELDIEYSKILEKTEWYDEINPIRDETIHFLTGLIIIGDSGTLGYRNIPKSGRAGTPREISIKDVEEHVKQAYNNAMHFLRLFADHFLKVIDQDSRISLPCVSSSDKVIGFRSISLREYLNGDQGICQGSIDCPEIRICRAQKS